jgi:Tol biopolymer transport system component
MRSKLIVCFLLLISAATFNLAQNVQVIDKVEVTSSEDGEFFHPTFSESGSEIIFTSASYQGLWLYSEDDKSIKILSNENGVGFNPVFDSKSSNIIARPYEFRNMKRISKLISINIETLENNDILTDQEDLYYPMKSASGKVFSIVDKEIQTFDQDFSKTSLSNDKVLFIENSNLVLNTQNELRTLNPLGNGNYLWPSFSSDGSKILFTKAGEGTFICDIQGNIISELGKANYPIWGKDDEWVIFMEDYDDGKQFIASDIKTVHINSGKSFNLTRTADEIEMYPDYSASTDQVVYHTTDGRIKKITLQFN